MKLYKHQQKLLNMKPKKCGIFWEVGTGKTLMAISLMIQAKKPLVICPKSLKSQWEEQTDHPVMTKEEFRKDHLKLEKYDCIVVDEAHFFFGMTSFKKRSAMAKSLLAYIKKHDPKYIYLLTGTPYMSTPYNIYIAGQIIGKKWNYAKFKEHFFSMVNFGMRFPVPVPKKGIEDDIAKLTRRIGDVVKMEDCFEVPKQIYQKESFNLTKEQEKGIDELIEEGIARWTCTHQICGGTLKRESGSVAFESEKFKRLVELTNEHKKIVVVCRYNNEIEVIKTLIKKKKILVINGATKNRGEVVKEAEKSEQCIVLVNASCSEGYELPSFPIMVFYSYDFSLKNYIQMKGRILRANKLKSNVYLSLVVDGTIDSDVYDCIQSKKDFDIKIFNKEQENLT